MTALPPWAGALLAGVLGVTLLRWGLGAVIRLLGRGIIALLFLLLLGRTGLLPGPVPGANPVTALVLGTLGAPGFALLLLLPLILT